MNVDISELKPQQRIILALDVSDVSTGLSIVDELKGYVGPIKIGLEAISAGIAHELADQLIAQGFQIFWDGKWKDIPNTVAGAARGLMKRFPKGIWAFNVHIDGGIPMMQAAVENKGSAAVLGVTELTSLDEEDSQILHGASVKAVVLQRSREAKLSGLDGLISSPQEVAMLRSHKEIDDLFCVNPAIRPDWAVPADQKRPTTPTQAILAGADFPVVGRPITQPPEGRSRQQAALQIANEIRLALKERE